MNIFDADDAPSRLPRYTLLGQRAASGAVRHVALLALDTEGWHSGDAVKVIEVAPPLRLGPGWTHQVPHVLAWIDLTAAEREAIDFWVHDLHQRRKVNAAIGRDRWDDFVLVPPRFPSVGPTRFSCAGLVWSAYADSDAAIELVDLDALPPLRRDEFIETCGFLDDPALSSRLADFGLGEGDAWPVLLPGYLFHAVRSFRRGAPSYRPAARDSAWPACAAP